ncbi:uncharacterized protein LTHEOB_3782 [Lasiodiplodia theobromae]|uniref:Uncharacterized protein n=1 Tax=Lasiodiplodia theobromae TaxID=45133 RepID=A0A5N5DKI8_9PEZI|nr:uncharacterized protein LTHEOB_3782 [Lasiodiplodia theobromae]KAB2578110.1 hypothetical protein DBV05_g3173 [Lasiodiplodia theobromae]KAF4534169.1 hypothetical protein LTHEOB_3782 [Lasiodiplodia theobromae]
MQRARRLPVLAQCPPSASAPDASSKHTGPTSSAPHVSSLDLRASPWRDDQTQPALFLAVGAGPFVSASPTPSAPEIHDPPRDAARRSPSPHRSPTPSDHASKMGSRLAQNSTHDPDQQQQPQQQHHEKPAPAQTRPQMPISASAPAGRLPRLLPADVSQYSEPTFHPDIVSTSSTSLAELAHLIRLQSYQEQRRCHARVRLHRSLVANALSARLVHCGELVHRTLVDHFRSDDKKGFAQLYNALHDVRNSCDATRRYALLEPDLEFGKTKTLKNERVNSFSTFMHEIPTKTRDDLLEFLSELRTNPDFLATRITSLSQQELASLTTFRQALDPIDSVMALQARGKPVPSSQKSQVLSGSTAVERLLSFQRHDPLSALIYTIFANSSGPDSTEDLRRTDIWSTTCARLITEGKPGSDKFIKSVLDAWAGMREWPGKTNLELYLMEVLQDGQFLLEKTEDASRQRGQPEARNTKDTIAADEFYDRSVLRLFEVIDDEPSAGGIPEGILEIGTAILKKLEDSRKHRTAAQTFIVSRWFFSTYLLNAIIHPESQGIMTGHHITEHARQKILKEIAIRAQKQVLDMTYNWKQAVPILPEIRHHIDNIMNRFKTRGPHKPVLLPAKAITSPRETIEVQPFVVICPSDIVTIVNSLYPERRPSSSHTEDGHHRGLASGASSISGVSLAFRNSSLGDASSILSQSAASSMTSDTTSREPLLEPHLGPVDSHHPLATGNGYPENEHKVEPTEEYGHKIRMTCSELTRILNATGSCHPCAEKWAVLYVSSDGKELRTRMRKDTETDDEPDEDSTESESEDEGLGDRMELENDYHAIKMAIIKLVEEYEIPKELAPESESKGFSNRASALRREARPSGPNRASSAPLGDKNPYHSTSQSQLSTMFANQRGTPPSRMRLSHGRNNSNADLKDPASEKPSVLVTMLEAAMNQCQARSDFVNAHLYFKTLQQLRKIQSASLTRNGYAALLNYFGRGPRESVAKSSSAIEEFEAWFVWLKQSQERHDEAIEDMMNGMKSLRDKMWYITDVRNSAGYEEAKNVALALKIMGQPTKTLDGKPIQTHRPRNPSKVANNFLLKTEAQVLDLMAAPSDHGGPNKLADEQSDMTLRWLKQYAIESSFCKGEERIHRFCLEIDKCVNKLVGDGILDGPVLWSSELYRRDKEVLDTGRQKGDLYLTGVGTLSIAGDEEYESHPGKSSLRSLDFAQRASNSSLRSVHRNGSQQSFDSGKWSGSRPLDLMDSQDYFGGSSPVLSIDSSNTFWSPFQTQAATSPTSATSIRPGSSRGTVMLKQSATVNEDKRRFLLDLKQTLTGLILSDLGTIVFSNGSETDSWFSGELGEECLVRKEEEEKRRKRAARKKSMRNLRSAAKEQRGGPGSENQSSTEHSSSGTDATARSAGISAKKAGLLEFPFNSAFRRLLHKFATHPNPFSKLHALYELELLIIASLSSRTGRHYSRRETLPTVPQSPTLGSVPEFSSREATANHVQAQNLEEAIANCEGRRSHSMMNGQEASAAPSFRNGARSPTGPPSTDMIVDVLTGLFRDANIRPKTLFRDLQYIASFVPAQMLDKTARGKAFWDAGLAALGLKQDICRIMVEIADDIVALNTQNRSAALQHAANSSSGASEKAGITNAAVAPSPDDPLNKFTMEDAARMLIITAKEGDAVAERELAIFYLTHPDLLPRTTLPLTKPTEVFKAELLQRDRKREDPARSDPITMCVAQHWMEMSKRGGDQLATKYLRARDEMERIP